MRRRARKDGTHDTIVRELRQCGATVLLTHQLGGDAPDLVVGYRGVTALVEVKPPGTLAHKDRVARQQAYLAGWAGGPAFVATCTQDVLDVLGAPYVLPR